MSTKRLCTSLLHAPIRSHCQTPSKCPISITVRDDLLLDHHHRRQQRHPPQQCRAFTLSHRRRAGQVSASRQVRMRQKAQPSMAVTMKKQQAAAMRDGSLVDHYGLLPGTIVPPTGKHLPSWTSNYRERLALEWHILPRRVMMFVSAVWFARFRTKPKIPLERSKVAGIAKQLYEDMYTNFAKGDLTPVADSLAPGFMGSLRARIAQRPANSSLKWTLEKYLSRPKLIWYQVALLDHTRPKDDQTGIIQAVVQIRSRQSLVKIQKVMGKDRKVREVMVDAEGNELAEEEDVEREKMRSAKDTSEYLVLQKSVKKSRVGPWLIWGTTEETSLAKMKKAEEQLTQAQRAARAKA